VHEEEEVTGEVTMGVVLRGTKREKSSKPKWNIRENYIGMEEGSTSFSKDLRKAL
jgi:hypothetical protein